VSTGQSNPPPLPSKNAEILDEIKGKNTPISSPKTKPKSKVPASSPVTPNPPTTSPQSPVRTRNEQVLQDINAISQTQTATSTNAITASQTTPTPQKSNIGSQQPANNANANSVSSSQSSEEPKGCAKWIGLTFALMIVFVICLMLKLA